MGFTFYLQELRILILNPGFTGSDLAGNLARGVLIQAQNQ